MRGKAAEIMAEHDAEGITPAYAGKRSTFGKTYTAPADHPRLCGEKNSASVRRLSSLRITPAYAGKSGGSGGGRGRARDHPRLCGEKQAAKFLNCHIIGSPPPMRGKDSRRSRPARNHGITPAYAGKSVPTLPSPDW